MRGRLIDISVGLNGRQRVTVELIQDFREKYEALKEDDVSVEIKKYHKPRSSEANAYFWLLVGKLAAVLHMPATEIYRHCVREIGDNFEIIPIREDAIPKWTRSWNERGAGWVVDDLGPCSRTPGYRNLKCYYGSSTYDSEQMSRLIDQIVEECKLQGIETATPEELARYKEG